MTDTGTAAPRAGSLPPQPAEALARLLALLAEEAPLEDYQAKYPNVTPSLGVVVGTGMADLMRQILDKACADGDLTPEGVVKAKQSLAAVETEGLLVPLDISKPGQSPSRQSYILRPADVPGGAKAVTEAYESPDVAELVGG